MDGVGGLEPEGGAGFMGVACGLAGKGESSRTGPLIALSALYFIFGFITCLNDVLVPQLKAVFELKYAGAMLGRFAGSAVMRLLAPPKVLAGNALAASVLVLTAMAFGGKVSMGAILSVGFFNSIMFPTIFTLAIKGLGQSMGQASGILCMAVVGGAVVPLAQGLLADRYGIRLAFVLPVLCYAYIAFYGAAGHLSARSEGVL
jgi:FHS family L-fucose permease-like MFS transporter